MPSCSRAAHRLAARLPCSCSPKAQPPTPLATSTSPTARRTVSSSSIHVKVQRPRALALGGDGALWIAADGSAEAPWARGPGEIWRVVGDAAPALMRRGPVAAGMALSSTGHLFVADRQAPDIFALAPDGRVISFAHFTDGDAPRSLT